ncbi:MAG: tetratricopeptide repeat protein [Vampirovibrionales bacterium]
MSRAFSSANPSFPFDDGLTPDELTELLSHTDAVVRGALAGLGLPTTGTTPSDVARECLNQGDWHYRLYQSATITTESVVKPLGQPPREGHLQQAIAHYRKALELQPGLSHAYIRLAETLWIEGVIGLEATLHYCELAIRHEPENLNHYLTYSQLLTQAGHYSQADAVLNLAKPLVFKANHLLASSQWAWQRASVRWQLSQLLDPSHEETSTLFGWEKSSILALVHTFSSVFHACLGWPFALTTWIHPRPHLVASLQVFQPVKQWVGPFVGGLYATLARISQVLGQIDVATRYWQHTHRWNPRQTQTLQALCDLAIESNQPERALIYAEEWLTVAPNDAALHLKTARLYKELDQLGRAQALLEKATAIQPADSQLFFELGQVQADQQNYLQALVTLKEANRLEPNHPYILANMAYVLFKLDDMEGAVSCYRQALDTGNDPVWRSAVAQTLGALYYQYHQDDVAAQETLELAVRLDADNTEARTMLAELLFETGQMQKALDLYQHLATLKPHDADIYSHMGYILWQMDRNDQALEAYHQALKHDPHNAIVYNNMGVIYLDEHYNGAEAAPLFEHALVHNAHYTLAAFNLGRSYELMGKTHEAAKAYSHALELVELNPELEKDDINERLHLLFSV